jgi:hypothetical protein
MDARDVPSELGRLNESAYTTQKEIITYKNVTDRANKENGFYIGELIMYDNKAFSILVGENIKREYQKVIDSIKKPPNEIIFES